MYQPCWERLLAGLFLVYTFFLDSGVWLDYNEMQYMNACFGVQILI
jgi:hypothetical protein